MRKDMDEAWIRILRERLENYLPPDPPGDYGEIRKQLQKPGSNIRKWIILLIGLVSLVGGALVVFNSQQDLLPVFSETNRSVPTLNPLTAATQTAETKSFSGKPTDLEKIASVHLPGYQHDSTDQQPMNPSDNQASQKHALPTADEPGLSAVSLPVSKQTSNKGFDDRKPFKISNLHIDGEPWKVALGYEYQALLKPDTGRGSFRGMNLRFDKEIKSRLWAGTGITLGRIDLIDVSKNWVRDWTKSDSSGTIYLRDSTTSEHRWQRHVAVPFSLTLDMVKTRRFAFPVRVGTTLGWSYDHGYMHVYENSGHGARGGKNDHFTGFITAELSIGYEYYSLNGLSVLMSVDYRRMLIDTYSFGHRGNFIGGRLLLCIDFDERKWR
jgi:hypothetical protein